MENGLVHIYCGDGKGKTTAAVGLAIRCAGNGFKVLYCSFLKNTCSGEHNVMAPVDVLNCDFIDKFCFQMNKDESLEAKKKTREYFKKALEKATEENYDMLILDEVLDAVDIGYLEENEIKRFVSEKPQKLELVLTGRRADEKLQAMAHYISEIKCIKHPYKQGITARRGIEM